MWEFIDKIVFINLEKRKDRLEKITEVCKVFPSEKVVRFNAIETPGFGILGCGKSHAAVLEMAIENGWNNVLILEDDATWHKFEEGYEKLCELIKTDYDVITLGSCIQTILYYNSLNSRAKGLTAMTAYIVHSKFYTTFLNNLHDGIDKLKTTGEHWHYACDQYWKLLQPDYNFLMIKPVMMYQYANYSDNANDFVDYEAGFKK